MGDEMFVSQPLRIGDRMKLFKVMSDKFNVNILYTLSNYPFVYRVSREECAIL